MDGFAASFGSLKCMRCAGGETVATLPWAVRMPAAVWDVMIYVFSGARCQIDVAGDTPTEISENSVAVVLRGRPHEVRGAIATTPRLAHHADPSIVGRFLTTAMAEQPTTATHVEVLGLSIEPGLSQHLFAALPDHFVLDFDGPPDGLNDRLRCLKRALRARSPGAYAVALRDAEALTMQIVADFAEARPDAVPRWWRRTDDLKLARIQTIIHRDLARPWTIDTLAAEAGMSRSRLTARAAAELGEGLMSYVNRVRMWEAARQLEQTRHDLGRVARAVGYGSDKAFITSFHRFWHVPPGEFRRLNRQPTASDGDMPARATSH